MEVNWLKDFLAVASTGNFSRAAETRNVTQPAFSRRLKALEMWIGVPLLDRSSYPITLTPAGARFLPVAERVVRDLHAGRDDVRLASTVGETTLKFAMPHSLAVGFFPKWWQVMTAAQVGMTAKVMADIFTIVLKCFCMARATLCCAIATTPCRIPWAAVAVPAWRLTGTGLSPFRFPMRKARRFIIFTPTAPCGFHF